MRTIIDLSRTIEDNMLVHPYDGEVRLYEDKLLDRDKYNNSRLEIGMHAGTHIDAPRHFLDSNLYMSDFEVGHFIGNGCLLDVRGKEVISFKEEYKEIIKENDIVLLLTGFSSKYPGEDYYKNFTNHPVVDEELARFFCNKKIKMLGIDMPKPDNYPFEIHKILLSNNIFIMENLVNLDRLVGVSNFEVIALPLKIKAEGSIVRAIARF